MNPSALQNRDLVSLRLAVVKAALHFPFAQIELSLRAAVQTRAIRTSVARKGAAHFCMPASKHSRHQAAELPSDWWRIK